jgi:hypothetical protein
MAGRLTDIVTEKLVDVPEVFARLEPKKVAELMGPGVNQIAEQIVSEMLPQVRPRPCCPHVPRARPRHRAHHHPARRERLHPRAPPPSRARRAAPTARRSRWGRRGCAG